MQGRDLQSSFDTAGELLRTRYRGWYLALAELPTWGEEIDRQVQVYINDVQNVTLANLNWRYLPYPDSASLPQVWSMMALSILERDQTRLR